MEANVGGYDRIARFVAGPILLVLGGVAIAGVVPLAEGTLGTALAAIALLLGIIFLVTAGTQQCVCNSMLGIDTTK